MERALNGKRTPREEMLVKSTKNAGFKRCNNKQRNAKERNI